MEKMFHKEESVLVERAALNERISEDYKNYKILNFYAHVGWGKTTCVNMWLKKSDKKYSWITVQDEKDVMATMKSITIPNRGAKENPYIMVLDDFHLIQDKIIIDQVVEYIIESPYSVCFFILSRAPIPIQFNPFVVTGQLISYGAEYFEMNEQEGLLFFQKNGIQLTETDKVFFRKNTIKHPLRLNAAMHGIRLSNNRLDEVILKQSGEDLCDYIKLTLFEREDKVLQNAMIRLADFEEFDTELAMFVTGEARIKEILDRICKRGSGWFCTGVGRYRQYWFVKDFLLREQRIQLKSQEIQTINQNTALYYELRGRKQEALKYYAKASCEDKIVTLLIEETLKGPGVSNFYNLIPYYKTLSEPAVLSHPVLCGGMAMAYSLTCCKEQSDYWYQKLISLKEIISKDHCQYKVLEEQINYLSIALPHTGTKGMISKLSAMAKYFTKNRLKLQNISITGNMPTLMHGGKDFCEWTKSKEILKRMLKGSLEALFEKNGIGLVDIGMGEAYYEENHLDKALLELTKGINEVQNKGTLEMLFAGTATLIRLMVAKNQYESACSMVEGLGSRIESNGIVHLLPNYKAFVVKLNLLKGNFQEIDSWFQKEAPDETKDFYTMDRYQYLVKARCYILHKKHIQAEIILERLRNYFLEYSRYFDYMEATLLMAILFYRKGHIKWKEYLVEVLEKAQRYKFIRLFADEGSAILPLLNKIKETRFIKGNIDTTYINHILEGVKQFAVLYPKYLEPLNDNIEELSPAELNVLKLLNMGMSNGDIAKFLNITLSTVKAHSSHIYAKLDVKNRHAAVQKAKQQGVL